MIYEVWLYLVEINVVDQVDPWYKDVLRIQIYEDHLHPFDQSLQQRDQSRLLTSSYITESACSNVD